MSVRPDSLATSEGTLISISISVQSSCLESVLEALAGVSFPVNPQIYHDAAVISRFPTAGITCAPLSATISPRERTGPRLQCSFSPANMTEVCEPICLQAVIPTLFPHAVIEVIPMPVINPMDETLFISPQG